MSRSPPAPLAAACSAPRGERDALALRLHGRQPLVLLDLGRDPARRRALALATKQLNFGIDFESGTRIKVALVKPTDEEGVRDALDAAGIERRGDPAGLRPGTSATTSSRSRPGQLEPEPGRRTRSSALDGEFGIADRRLRQHQRRPDLRPAGGRTAPCKALIFSLLVICAYVAFRFDPKFAVPVLIAIFHDILITAGVYSLTGREVTSGTVAAFLTILGYSLYDTIIVFDRIRENMPRMPRAAFSQIVNRSMSEVLTRSLATSFSTLLGVVSLLIFGGATLQDFAFAMLVGIASGTYSSIFIASPVLTAWKEREPGFARRRERIAERRGQRCPPSPTTIEMAKLGEDDETDEEIDARIAAARRRRGSADGRAAGDGGRSPALDNGASRRRPSRPGRGRAPRAQRAPPRAPPAAPQAREESLMALLVWFTMGIALWHFTVFLPDRFWQGIVGAFLGSTIGAIVFGAIVEIGKRPRPRRHRPRHRPDGDPGRRDRPRRSSTRSASAPSEQAGLRRRILGAGEGDGFRPGRFLAWLRGGIPQGLQGRPVLLRGGAGARRRAGAERAGRDHAGPARATARRRQARAFLEADESHSPSEFDSMGEVVDRVLAARARGAADHRPRRLRRRRGLRDHDPGRRPARAGGRVRLADPRPPRRRLRAQRRQRRAAGRARHLAADHRRLRDHRGRGGRAGPLAGDGGHRHRPPPARRGAARLPDPAPDPRAATRSPSCAGRRSPGSWPAR